MLVGPLLGATLLVSHAHGEQASHGHFVRQLAVSRGHRVLEASHHARHDIHDEAHFAPTDAGEHEGLTGEIPVEDPRGTPFPTWAAASSGRTIVDLPWQPMAKCLTGALMGNAPDSKTAPAPDPQHELVTTALTKGVERVLRTSGALLI